MIALALGVPLTEHLLNILLLLMKWDEMLGEGHALSLAAAMSRHFRGSQKVGIMKTVELDGVIKFNNLQ